MKKSAFILLALYALCVQGFAQTTQPSGALTVTINNGTGTPQSLNLNTAITSTTTPGSWTVNMANNANLFSYTDSNGNAEGVTLDSLQMNEDPYLNYSFSLQTNGTPTEFSISFSLPTTATTLPVGDSTVYSGLIFDASSSPSHPLSFNISPVTQAIQEGTVGGVNSGILLGTSSLTLNTAPAGLAYEPISTSGDFYNTVAGGEIVVTDTFTVGASSNGGPIALGVAGNFEIDPNLSATPEPSSWALALLCVASFVYLRARRTAS